MYQLRSINSQHNPNLPQQPCNQHMNQVKSQQNSSDQEYRLSSFRYINLAIYILTAMANSLPAQTFSSMNSLVQDKFQISAVYITLNALMFPVMHPIAAFPSGWIIDRFGMKIGCCLGGFFVILGTWLRSILTVGNPWLCLLGSLLAAFGNVFVLNSSALMAVNWFQSQLVPKIIMFCVLTNFLSAAMGASVAGWFLDKYSTNSDIIVFLRWEAVIITIPFILFMVFFRQNPESPPSHAATLTSKHNETDYKQTLKTLYNNKQYIKIGFTAAFSFGTVISFFSLLNQCLTTLGFSNPEQVTSATITSMMISSIASILISSHYVKKTKKYKLIITVCLIGSIVTFSLLQLIFITVFESIAVLIAAGIVTGLFVFPLNSLLIAYASDVAFPVGQGSITGYIFAFSQTFGFIIGIAFISWIDRMNAWKIYVTFATHTFFFIVALYFNFSTRQILNRTNFQKEKLIQNGQQQGQL